MNKKFSHFLPSTGLIIFIIIPVFSFITFFIARDFFVLDKEKKIKYRVDRFTEVLDKESKEKDTDGDGLLDWQEGLYGTDINNEDTDTDGILDGKEVQMGTDPMDPFNKASEIKKSEDKKSYKNDKELSSTDVISRDFFIKLMELKQSSLSFNKNAQKQAVDELIQNNQIILSETYNAENLNISKRLNLRYFKINMTKILSKYRFEEFTDERYLYSRFLKTNNKKFVDQINKQLVEYKKMQEELIKLQVPEKLQILYLEYMNSFSLFIQVIESLENFKDDPVLVSSIILLYNKVEKRLADSSKALTYYFKVNIK